MHGDDVRRLREALGLDAYAFAATLGVHVSTLYRWEQTKKTLAVDPLQAQILERLTEYLRQKKAAEKKELGEAILAGLLAGGALVGLAALLARIAKK